MLHTANPVIKHKAGLLNLAEELSNVSKACKIMGVSRDTFYRYRELVAEGGVDAQINRSRRAPNLKNRTDEATEQAVVDYAVAFPTHGQHRASNELRKQGVLSPTVVSVLSGYSITLRISKDDTEQILSGDGRSVKSCMEFSMQSARLSVPPLNLGLSGRRTGACHPGVPLVFR